MSLADRINTMLPLHPFVGAGSHEGRSIHTTAAEVCGASRLLEARIYHRYPRQMCPSPIPPGVPGVDCWYKQPRLGAPDRKVHFVFLLRMPCSS
jgi:hypothetical protein